MPTLPALGITGASGTLGKVLVQHLGDDFDVRPMSRSIDGTNLMDLPGLVERFAGLDAVVHLAWQYADSDQPDTASYYDNITMSRNVLEAAASTGVSRVLLASSVHADYFYDHQPGDAMLDPHRRPRGNGPYGCAKVIVEELGREFATEALRVGCIRYGAVTQDDQPHPDNKWERRVWLSHLDLTALIRAALTQDWPEPFALCYAVSDNEGRVHDLQNPFGWSPRDSASAM